MTHPMSRRLYATRADYYGKDESVIDEAVAELDRLHAIVERLPKTADGVPVVPGMKVYAIGRHGDIEFFIVASSHQWDRMNQLMASDYTAFAVNESGEPIRSFSADVDCCYSTREAALAAKDHR